MQQKAKKRKQCQWVQKQTEDMSYKVKSLHRCRLLHEHLKDIKITSVCQILNIESIRKDNSPKSKNSVIIYSSSCRFKPKCLPFVEPKR